jgi:ABC-type multidrug transport system fused ATPase/permease subunit
VGCRTQAGYASALPPGTIDTRTERLIEKGLDALMHDRTVFVIAHRLSTVRNADAIIVIEDGASSSA